ncbi:Ditrans,polycis-undecaprenyl-diphosphate synthase ((2E,6E)-farnesyl-diphosphate specific) [bioreactor metagenome]|uniref:Ditrans,polycis-undecaprenyl-diphosphate synthase ((2E,6E)-farnesyl-diphosphate specific) n=1 Tax=bioreactor metagenome TaxID=1076179 RepID=A0A645A077_9ZZZZ|nr:isoprenyl transferase [Candidatus Metalachnospira sp.]
MDSLINEIDMSKLPKSIALIMDGNGRWAKKRLLPRQFGHKAGADTLDKIARVANKLGVMHLTVYAFSTENWNRSQDEVGAIMDLLRSYLNKYIKLAGTENIKIDFIGEKSKLAEDIQQKIIEIESLSACNTGLNLHIALNYGGRDEILRGVKKIASMVESGELKAKDITEDTITSSLDTHFYPDPELVIRTSGEERISNFLLWQIAYSEFVFNKKLWPDYTEEDLYDDICYFQNRERRFGGR